LVSSNSWPLGCLSFCDWRSLSITEGHTTQRSKVWRYQKG
jgi:hypothetical protein